jgi:hypothetical protein
MSRVMLMMRMRMRVRMRVVRMRMAALAAAQIRQHQPGFLAVGRFRGDGLVDGRLA